MMQNADVTGALASGISNLSGDRIATVPGGTVLIDVNGNATVAAGVYASLTVNLGSNRPQDRVGIRETNGGLTLPGGLSTGGEVRVADTRIGRIAFADQHVLVIEFITDNATPERIQELIRALTYSNQATDPLHSADQRVIVYLKDQQGNESAASVDVSVAPAGAIALTNGVDNFVGTDAAEVYLAWSGPVETTLQTGDVIDGGNGVDTIKLAGSGSFHLDSITMTGIEVILGTDGDDHVLLDVSQVAPLTRIDGGEGTADTLHLRGNRIALTKASVVNFERINVRNDGAELTVDDVSLALIAAGRGIKDDHLILTTGTLNAAQRKAIHDQGIDKITDGNGVVSVNTAPRLTGLDGTNVRTAVGHTVAIDVNADALLTDDDTALDSLTVNVWNALTNVLVGIRTEAGRVELTRGYEFGSTVWIDGVRIGSVFREDNGVLTVFFNDAATPARVQTLLRALTYTNLDPANQPAQHSIEILVSDKGGRYAQANLGVSVEANLAPTRVDISRQSVLEKASNGSEVGALTAQDANPGETFTYTLLDNAEGRFAIKGDKVVVADGTRLDYEAARSHDVTVRVTDGGGLTFDRRLTVTVQDIIEGTGRNDVLVGTVLGDTIEGGAGNDRLFGRQGQDLLTGGSGRDVFVFDSSVARKNNTNVDRISDFVVKDDSIWLDNAIFKALGQGTPKKPAMLTKDAFWIGAKAHDRDDRVIYDAKKGNLFYDADGSGKGAAILIATLQPKLKMTHADFFVI